MYQHISRVHTRENLRYNVYADVEYSSVPIEYSGFV